MSSNTVSRETVRDALFTMFNTALVGVGKPAEVMFGYKAGDFDRRSPVVVLTGGGSDRMFLRPQPNGLMNFYFELHLFALYAVVKSDNTFQWTDAQSEDKIDALEKAAIDAIIDNADLRNVPTAVWQRLFVTERSAIDEELVGNDVYRHEQMELMVEVSA